MRERVYCYYPVSCNDINVTFIGEDTRYNHVRIALFERRHESPVIVVKVLHF